MLSKFLAAQNETVIATTKAPTKAPSPPSKDSLSLGVEAGKQHIFMFLRKRLTLIMLAIAFGCVLGVGVLVLIHNWFLTRQQQAFALRSQTDLLGENDV